MNNNKNGKPIELSLFNKTERRNKEFIKDRIERESVMRIGNQLCKPTERILTDAEALKKWNEIVDIFKTFSFVTDVDSTFIERYCLTYSEYCQLQDTKNALLSKGLDDIQTFHAMDKINLHYQINKKLEILMKYEDRMFLNPASRIRNIPQKSDEKPAYDPIDKMGISNV